MEQWHKDLNNILESRHPAYINERNHVKSKYKGKPVIDNDNCYHDAKLNCTVHRYKPAQRTCICGKDVTPTIEMKSHAVSGFRHALSPVAINYKDEWKSFSS
jgi:hypothetical protein